MILSTVHKSDDGSVIDAMMCIYTEFFRRREELHEMNESEFNA